MQLHLARRGNVHWELNDPARCGGRGRRRVDWASTAGGGAPTTTVTVYERFQMDATQPTTGADKSFFGQQRHRTGHHGAGRLVVRARHLFVTGSVVGHLMHGVHVGAFSWLLTSGTTSRRRPSLSRSRIAPRPALPPRPVRRAVSSTTRLRRTT